MTILHSLPTLLLLGAAILLTALGTRRGSLALSFFGGLSCSAALLCALLAGAELKELLVCVLASALACLAPRKEGGA